MYIYVYVYVCVCVSVCVYHFSSVAQLCLTLCNPMDCKHSGRPRPSPTCSNSRPSSWWCHPTISSSVVPFSSCLQSFPASGSFPMSQFFTSGGQSIGVYVYIRTYVCGLPWWASWWLSGKEHTCHWRRYGFDPWKIPWRRKWQLTPVFLLGKFHGQRSLACCNAWGRKESDTTERLDWAELKSYTSCIFCVSVI